MALTKEKIKKYTQRLLLSRMRILNHHSFYGLLLMRMVFAVDENVDTACTNGKRIVFGTDFLESLSDNELDFVMMHEILHVVLQHCARGTHLNQPLFNIACDIVVNSNILLENNMDIDSITLREYGESIHLTPDGQEGYLYNAEDVYFMLKKHMSEPPDDGNTAISSPDGKPFKDIPATEFDPDLWDDHSKWGMSEEEAKVFMEEWHKNLLEAVQTLSISKESSGCGHVPAVAKRILEEIKESRTDWRALLADFIQPQSCDYTFSPPDKRFADSGFFLPDLNETDFTVQNILFMVDTSGSMSNQTVNEAYSAVKDAIRQFEDKMNGWLGFFDTKVDDLIPFSENKKLRITTARGGGGTSFHCIFDFVRDNMMDNLPTAIIILTDGEAPYPPQKNAMDIPVLWLITNDRSKPPWGKVARMKI